MSHGESAKLCRFFLPMWQKAMSLNEAVVCIKYQSYGIGDTVIIFPCGIQMTIAMRTPSRHATRHHIMHSGEDSASKWIFGKYWNAFYRMFHESDGGIPLSKIASVPSSRSCRVSTSSSRGRSASG